MALFLCSLQLTNQDILMHLDFLFTLFHGHFELIFSVLKTVDFVCTGVDFLTKTLNLELHDIMLHESLLLHLDNGLEVTASHFVLKLEFTDNTIQSTLLSLNLGDDSVDISALILQLLVRGGEKLQVFFGFFKIFAKSVDLL